MKISKEDIEKTEEIGSSEKGSILHILTKGGLSMIVRKSLGGAMEVMASAPHPGIARFRAEQVDKSIQWENNLFKSETEEIYVLEKAKVINIFDESGKQIGSTTDTARAEAEKLENERHIANSTPEKHYKEAQHQSHKAGRHAARDVGDNFAAKHDKNMMILMHTDEALKHYQMAGMDRKQAMEEHRKNMANHLTFDDAYENLPHTEKASERGFRLSGRGKNKKITGLGYNWSE